MAAITRPALRQLLLVSASVLLAVLAPRHTFGERVHDAWGRRAPGLRAGAARRQGMGCGNVRMPFAALKLQLQLEMNFITPSYMQHKRHPHKHRRQD